MSTLHQQQLIDLSRNAGVNTGLRLAFSDQQNSLSPPQLYLMSKDLSTQIHQQRYEIDHFLQLQGEELRRTLAEKWRRQNYALLEAAEVSVSRRLKEKDDEAEKAVWRKAELEARAAQLRMEAEVWKARATTQEAEAVSLQVQLQHAIFSSGGSQGCGSGGETEDAESAAYIDPERVVVMVRSGPGCKACGKGVASVVLLPCRHLCVCGECEGVVLACPLCLSLRTSSVQVYMS